MTRLVGLTGEPVSAAFEWNLWRTMRVSATPPSVLRPREARILAMLTGFWVAGRERACYPHRGRHLDACPHFSNAIPIRYGVLASSVFGDEGGSQRRQARAAVERLLTTTVSYETVDADGNREIAKGPVLEGKSAAELSMWFDGDTFERIDVVVGFGAPLLRSLLAGHFQTVPTELVKDLDDSAFLIWLGGLCQTWRRPLGEPPWIRVTGTYPWIPRWRLGLARSTVGEVRGALERARDRGNAAQSKYRLELSDLPPRNNRKRAALSYRVVRNAAPDGEMGGNKRRSGRQRAARFEPAPYKPLSGDL